MFWIYKCNAKGRSHQRTWGDWAEVFESAEAQPWGTTRIVPDLRKAKRGHTIIAYQTDRNELVGLATVVGWERDGPSFKWLIVKPTHRLGVKVRSLKETNRAIARIPALQPGPIKTLYPISDSDARALLKAASQALKEPLQGYGDGSKAGDVLEGAGLGTPAQNKLVERAAVRHVRDHYRAEGWSVVNVSAENLGYDLLCRLRRSERHVEVKGASGGAQQFIITANELATWKRDEHFVLALVAFALQSRPSIIFFPGKAGRKEFSMEPLAYVARRIPS